MLGVLQNVLIFALSLGFLVLLHEFGHFIIARFFGVKVNKFSIGFGPKLFTIARDKTTEYILSAVPLGGYVDMSGERPDTAKGEADEFLSKPRWQRALIVAAGPGMNLLLGFALFWVVYATGAPEQLPYVGSVSEGMPAAEAGIKPGDRILSIDGIEFALWDDMAQYVHERPGREMTVIIERGGNTISLTLRPKLSAIPNLFGEEKQVGLMGITPDIGKVEIIRFGFLKGFLVAARKVLWHVKMTLQALLLLLTGNKHVLNSVTGPIGIYSVTSAAWKAGFNVLLMIMGMLSLSLAIFNLLPIPILDGGHLLFLAVESVLKRPLPEKVVDGMYNAGFGILMALLAIVMFNDIKKMFFKGKIRGEVAVEKTQDKHSISGQPQNRP